MSRTIEYSKDDKCDNCGRKGVYDIMGDKYCMLCCLEDKTEGVFIKKTKRPKLFEPVPFKQPSSDNQTI